MGKYVFGVDVGGTTVKLGLFDVEGNLLDKWEIPTRKDNGGENILPDVAASIKAKMAEKNVFKDDVIGVGLGAPGPVDAESAPAQIDSAIYHAFPIYCHRQTVPL